MGKIIQQPVYLSDRVQGLLKCAGRGFNDNRGSSLSKCGLQPRRYWSPFVMHINSWENSLTCSANHVSSAGGTQVAWCRWRPGSILWTINDAKATAAPPVLHDDCHNAQHTSCGWDDSSQNSQRQSTSLPPHLSSLSALVGFKILQNSSKGKWCARRTVRLHFSVNKAFTSLINPSL